MSTPVRTEIQAFLDRFFAAPNLLKPDSKPEIQRWVDRLTLPEALPTVLPCWREGRIVDWYALAFDARQLRTLGESLTAFVGPTYTTFRGQLARLDPSDPIEQAVADLTAGNAYHFRGADPAEIWKALERMRKVWERRTNRERASPASVGHVLRDFYMALTADDQNAAEGCLSLLRGHYHLDGVNALYLQVQFLSAFRRWADLLDLPQFADLLRLRRPAAVTEALIKAVYQTHLATFEDPSNPEEAVATFRSGILGRYGSLFAARAGMQSPEAAKAFMLLAVARQPADFALRDALLSLTGFSDTDREYLMRLGALAGSTPSPPKADPLALAGEAVQASNFDRAFALAHVTPPSLERARILCECAVELGTLDSRAAAIEAVNTLSSANRTVFLARRVNQQLWEDLREDLSPAAAETVDLEPVPTDWCSWLNHIDRHEEKNGSREIARRGASEWSVAEFLAKTGTAERFTSQLAGSRSQAAEHVLRDCLPHLLAFFHRDPAWPNPMLKGVYRSLLDLLFFSTEGGRADLVAWNDLLDAALMLGVEGETSYRECITYMKELWARFGAPITLDWAIDSLGLLVAHACPDTEARRSFFVAILDRSTAFLRHVEPEQRELLQLLASDLGEKENFAQYFITAPPAERAEDEVLLASLSGLSVAVYTLTESAGRQFKMVLDAQSPGVRVSLCHDVVASPRLKQLARQADLFVVAVSSAKHAATACIAANRPLDRPTLYPSGKGAASMIRAIREHLRLR
jgi:hypothetical protein